MSAVEQTRPPFPPPFGDEDDVIELTEVAEDSPAEALIELHRADDPLASLKPAIESPEKKPDPPQAAREQTLDDFLASLPDLQEDLDIPPEAAPPQVQAAPEPPGEVAGRVSDAELRDMVRQTVQETVERLVREMLPKMAVEAIDRELALLKKRLLDQN